MSTARRRILRSPRSSAEESRRHQKLLSRRSRLQKEQQSLARWMTRFKRAFHAVEKQQKTVSWLEREITKLEG